MHPVYAKASFAKLSNVLSPLIATELRVSCRGVQLLIMFAGASEGGSMVVLCGTTFVHQVNCHFSLVQELPFSS